FKKYTHKMLDEFYILNSSGCLIYRYIKDNTDINKSMIISSLFYSISCISKNVSDNITEKDNKPIIILNLNKNLKTNKDIKTKEIVIYSTWTDTTFVFVFSKSFHKNFYSILIDEVYNEYNLQLQDPFYNIDGIITELKVKEIFDRYKI
ncbi:hypothetical protein SLOPH_1725, partial [Spraguea lophii 42_110]